MLTTTATELNRLMRCIGSRLMPAAIPDNADPAKRDEGNAAHWLAEQMWRGGGEIPAVTAAPNGFVITSDMIDHVASYVSALGPGGDMECDTSYAGQGWEVRGRADHLNYVEGGASHPHVLTIDDFKYGWRIVEPRENYTLLSHAIGWCIKHQVRPDRIILRIHQPRPFHADGSLREWSCTFDELMGYYTRIEQRLSNPTDELVSGLDQCAKCHARFDCPAARRAGMNAIDATTMAFDETLPDHVLAYELETLRTASETVKNRLDALEELMTYKVKQGTVFPGYALDSRLGQRRWVSGMSGKALSALAGVDLTNDSIVTPAEAERRGVSKEAIKQLTERPTLPAKLRKVDVDARARAAFGDG